MKALHRKLLRDIGKMKGQMAAVSLIMACGIAVMIMSRSLIQSVESTRDAYYEQYRFADVFCDLKRAPNSLRERLAEIDGVAAVDTRVVGKVTLLLPGFPDTADGLVHSLPEDRPARLNLLFLRLGRMPEIGSRNEVVVGEAFAKAHGFIPGAKISAVIHGARQTLTIVGIALSPEYVFEARPGESLPDNRRFGVFWMNERELSAAFQLTGAFNNVLVDVAPGANPVSVMAELDRVLMPYGGLIAYHRKDHASATRLNDELRVLTGISVAFPAVFLSIAAFMTSAMLSRLIRLQREQIAQLKAFGYSSGQVGAHYMGFALLIVVVGVVVGAVAGMWLGGNMVTVYKRFFQFPALIFYPHLPSIGAAIFISSGSSFLGVIGSVLQVMRLPPAEAMRPEPPADFKYSILERLGLGRFASPAFRMVLRNIERKPFQAMLASFGLALATGIPVVPGALRDGIQYILNFQWDYAQRQDLTLSLLEPGSASALSDLRGLPGVLTAEPFRSVPARIRFGHVSRRLGVVGLLENGSLNRILDGNGQALVPPSDGVLISSKLGEVLGAQVGDKLILEVQEGSRPQKEVRVQGFLTDFAGLGAYMEISSLHQLMREGESVSGAYLRLDENRLDAFLDKVREAPKIASLAVKRAVRGSFQKSTGEMIGMIQGVYFGFAVVVAFGVVYNSASIALSERSRDLATLRVIGFTHGEVVRIMIGEIVFLTVVALPIGLGIGSFLANLIIQTASTETVRLPLILSSRTYATAVLIVVVSATVSCAIVSRRIRMLDLLGVLKSTE
ncbi:MAG: FtsX-like permease family protein [Verrucomicrobiota bacterium]